MFEKLPPEYQQITLGLLSYMPTAALARFLVHHRLVRLGKRKLFDRAVWVELPTAAFSAIIGGGIAEGLNLDGMAAHAIVGACGWMGPYGLEVMATNWFAKKGG